MVTLYMVTLVEIHKALNKMKCDKAAGPSGIIAEMMKAAGEECIVLLRDLAESVFSNCVIPKDWEESYILNLYKGKGNALNRGNYRGLKLTDQAMKLLERVLDSSIVKWSTLTPCSSALCLARALLMQFSSYTNYRRCTLLQTSHCTLPLSTRKGLRPGA